MSQWRKFEFQPDKFRELVLHLAEQSSKDGRFGSTKLNKLLYYIDTRSFLVLGAPMTGATYRHLPAGPVPYPILETRRQLVDAGHAHLDYKPYFNRTQERLVADRAANMNLFSQRELEIIDVILEELWDYNASELSVMSHEELGWKLTGDYEEIPYELSWVSPDPLTLEQIERGKEIAAAHGLLSD